MISLVLITFINTTSNTRKDLLIMSKVIVNSLTGELVKKISLNWKKSFFKEGSKSPLDRHAYYLTMGKGDYPYYKVPVPFIPEEEKDPDEGNKKGVSMKLT
jgi:hypothetical protein